MAGEIQSTLATVAIAVIDGGRPRSLSRGTRRKHWGAEESLSGSWLGAAAVISVDLVGPGRVGEIGPIVLVKARGIGQPILLDIDDGALIGRDVGDRFPRNSEMLVAQAENPAEREDGVSDLIVSAIDDHVLDLAKIFTGSVHNLRSDEGFL
jgi:hypothetical protein